MLSLRVAMDIFSHLPDRTPGALLLDQVQVSASMVHTFLWETTRLQGVPPPVLRAFQGLYRGGTARAMLMGEMGRPFAVSSGIRQGCPASGRVGAIL